MVDRELLDALAEELNELGADLASELAILRDPNAPANSLAAAIDQYASYTRRLGQAAEMLEMSALHQVADFVTDNVRALSSVGAEIRCGPEMGELFEGWAPKLDALLRAADDEQHRDDLTAHLASAHWPVVLPDRNALTQALNAELGGLRSNSPVASHPARASLARPEDVLVQFTDDINPQLVDAFLQETPLHVSSLSEAIQALSSSQARSEDLSRAQRLAHTIKGSANITGVSGVANLTHHAEDILEHLSETGQKPGAELADLLLRVSNCLEVMLEHLTGLGAPPEDGQPVLQELLDWANRMDRGESISAPAVTAVETPAAATVPAQQSAAPGQQESGGANVQVAMPTPVAELEPSAPINPDEILSQPAVPLAIEETIATATAEATPSPAKGGAAKPAAPPPPAGETDAALRVAMSRVDALLRLAGEMTTAIVQVTGLQRRLKGQATQLNEQNSLVQQRLATLQDLVELRGVPSMRRDFVAVDPAGRAGFDPLELDEYNELHSATNALAETLTDVREMTNGVRNELAGLDDMVVQQQQISTELNNEVLSARMVPVHTVAARLHRGVRQACRVTGKRVRLDITGEDMQLDSVILSNVVDPLLHLLRNAVDHGIEEGAVRSSRGKAAEGLVRLHFSREGETVMVVCEDDGSGLDYERIRQTAIEKGLVDPSADLDGAQLARFTLLPGFTTRADATQLSGRGIGLDVVQKNISDLRGTISIESVAERGTRVEFRVPLTLISMHVLLVTVAGRTFGIPSSSLEQLIYSDAGAVSGTDMAQRFEYRDDKFPVRSLRDLLGLGAVAQPSENGVAIPLMLVRGDDGFAAVVIDNVVDGRYLVVKRLGGLAPKVRGVVGASILADGSVAPVLDIRELLRAPATIRIDAVRVQALSDAAMQGMPNVLIVDDSLSARRTLSQVVSEAGYEARTAVDGLEAIESIEKRLPDAVLLDLEMPRMNGLELASHLRADEQTKNIPLVMVTSRSTIKHRDQARAAGVDVFVTKPYEDAELAEELRRLIAAS